MLFPTRHEGTVSRNTAPSVLESLSFEAMFLVVMTSHVKVNFGPCRRPLRPAEADISIPARTTPLFDLVVDLSNLEARNWGHSSDSTQVHSPSVEGNFHVDVDGASKGPSSVHRDFSGWTKDRSRPHVLKEENLNEGRFSSFRVSFSLPSNFHHQSFGKAQCCPVSMAFMKLQNSQTSVSRRFL